MKLIDTVAAMALVEAIHAKKPRLSRGHAIGPGRRTLATFHKPGGKYRPHQGAREKARRAKRAQQGTTEYPTGMRRDVLGEYP